MSAPIKITLRDVGCVGDVSEDHRQVARRLVSLYNAQSSDIAEADRKVILEALKGRKEWKRSVHAQKAVSAHPIARRIIREGIPYWKSATYANWFILAGTYGDVPSLSKIQRVIEKLYGKAVPAASLPYPGAVDQARLDRLLEEEAKERRAKAMKSLEQTTGAKKRAAESHSAEPAKARRRTAQPMQRKSSDKAAALKAAHALIDDGRDDSDDEMDFKAKVSNPEAPTGNARDRDTSSNNDNEDAQHHRERAQSFDNDLQTRLEEPHQRRGELITARDEQANEQDTLLHQMRRQLHQITKERDTLHLTVAETASQLTEIQRRTDLQFAEMRRQINQQAAELDKLRQETSQVSRTQTRHTEELARLGVDTELSTTLAKTYLVERRREALQDNGPEN